MQETPVQFLGQEDPLEKGKTTHSSILAYSPWGCKESDMTETFTLHTQDYLELPFLIKGLNKGKGF